MSAMKRFILLASIVILYTFTNIVFASPEIPVEGGFYQLILSYNIPVIFVLYLIGVGLKKTELIKDKYIPIILTLVGWVMLFFYMLINGSPDLNSFGTAGYFIINTFIQAIFVSAASVWVNQVYKQLKKKE